MSITAAITVNQILSRVAVESGLDQVTDPFGSTASEYVQLKALLQTGCEDLSFSFPWEFLTNTLEITTELNKTEYDLPAGFLALVSETGWNRSTDEPIFLITPQQWRAMEAGDIQPVSYAFRIMGGKINFMPSAMAAGVVLTFEYVSRNFVATDAVPPVLKDTISAGSDKVLFDRTLIVRYLKVLWLETKGFDSTAAQGSFNQVYEMLIGKDKGGQTLNAGRSRGGFRLIDGRNLPSQGYGL